MAHTARYLLVLVCVAACATETPPPPLNPLACPSVATTPSAPATTAPEPVAVAVAPAPAPVPPPPQDAYATVHGLKMHYMRQGSGPALVLLQGGTTSAAFCWTKVIPFFSSSFDVIAPDQMGHGQTADDPKRAFDYHAMAEDTVELLSQLGVTSASFIGWSDGGDLALDIALHHPTLAKKIVTSGANTAPDGMLADVLKVIRDPHLADLPLMGPIRDEYAKLSPDGAAHWPLFIDRLRKMWVSQPKLLPRDLAAIKAPALIMAGDHDFIRMEHTVAIAHGIPGARLAIVPNEGHSVMVDRAPWDALVLAFLKEEPQSASAK